MGEEFWNAKAEYLRKSRDTFWNNDYMQFLVEKVWKIDKPVNLVDFGCGRGFVGTLLLPILPEGSTYTGIDWGETLLNEATDIFANSPYIATFIKADLTKYQPVKKYDIAICHTVLQHIPDAIHVLEKMRDCVVDGGKVICIETDRNAANAAMYFHGVDYTQQTNHGILQKLWLNDWHNGGSDHTIGMKIPVYMREIGLRDIGVRANDCVNFINPKGDMEDYKKNYDSLINGGWGVTGRDKQEVVNSLMGRGLTREEAEYQYECEIILHNYVSENKESTCIVNAGCLIISFGTV